MQARAGGFSGMAAWRRQAAVLPRAIPGEARKIRLCRELFLQPLSDPVQPVAIAVANTVAPLAVSIASWPPPSRRPSFFRETSQGRAGGDNALAPSTDGASKLGRGEVVAAQRWRMRRMALSTSRRVTMPTSRFCSTTG